jgi:hypothetical protein
LADAVKPPKGTGPTLLPFYTPQIANLPIEKARHGATDRVAAPSTVAYRARMNGAVREARSASAGGLGLTRAGVGHLFAGTCAGFALLVACQVDERTPGVSLGDDAKPGDEIAMTVGVGEPPMPARGEPGSGSEISESATDELSERDEANASASLVSNAEVFDFGGVHAGGEPVVFDWTITNIGAGLSGPLTLTQTGDPQFTVQNDCLSRLVAASTCRVRITFKPDTAEAFSSSLSITHEAGSLTLALLGKGQNRMTIIRVGRGEVTSSPEGLRCEGERCVGLFDPVVITFTARTANGSNSHFANWNGTQCRAKQSCSLTMSRSGGATARFAEVQHNLVFTSSSRFSPHEGSLAAYDQECNRLASEAGINDVGGDAFIAAMSDSRASLRQRLGQARGWVRMDGLPFADTPAGLFDGLEMSYYVAYDELGTQVPTPQTARAGGQALNVLSGSLADGSSSAEHCNDWTSSASDTSFLIGRTASGPIAWINTASVTCDTTLEYRVVCMGITRTNPLPAPTALESLAARSKQIWLTNTEYVPGSMTPDEKCQSERPPGVSSADAFVAYTDRAAATVLDPAATYRRPDGMLVGTGADLASMDVFTAPWIRAEGGVPPLDATPAAWTGSSSPTVVAIASENCDDWLASDALRVGLVGNYLQGSVRFFDSDARPACDRQLRLYCVER